MSELRCTRCAHPCGTNPRFCVVCRAVKRLQGPQPKPAAFSMKDVNSMLRDVYTKQMLMDVQQSALYETLNAKATRTITVRTPKRYAAK